MAGQSPIAEHLLAFASLYDHMAEEAWSEIKARELRRRAEACRHEAIECEIPTQERMFK